jgi:FKBP12-rapamycin complex-associated protein
MAMLALYSDVELLELELSVLISPDPLARKRTAALEIRAHVESAARELSLDRFAKFENELYKQIFSFIHSEKMNAKFGGILAIQQLIDCSSALAEQKQMKFASTLSFALKENSEFYLIQLVAETIGQMAKLSPVPAYIDYIENELNWALEGLRADTQHRRLAACAILQQLGMHCLIHTEYYYL